MSSPEVLVEVHGLWEGYRKKGKRGWRSHDVKWALSDVSFDLRAGEILGVIGRNGSGKSTLLQSLVGVFPESKGKVIRHAKASSLVDLLAGFHRELTGRENVMVAGVLLGLRRSEVRRRFDAIAAFAGLEEDALESPLRTYSAGMGLRLGFSVVINSDPRILLVDEVLAVGDEAFQQRCVSKIKELVASGCGVVLVSHDLELVERECHECIVLETGKMVFRGSPEEAVSRYRDMGGSIDEMSAAERSVLSYGMRWRRRRG